MQGIQEPDKQYIITSCGLDSAIYTLLWVKEFVLSTTLTPTSGSCIPIIWIQFGYTAISKWVPTITSSRSTDSSVVSLYAQCLLTAKNSTSFLTLLVGDGELPQLGRFVLVFAILLLSRVTIPAWIERSAGCCRENPCHQYRTLAFTEWRLHLSISTQRHRLSVGPKCIIFTLSYADHGPLSVCWYSLVLLDVLHANGLYIVPW